VSLLTPETKIPARPTVDELEQVNLQSRILYLRSYLFMRTLIGFIGLTLPIVLIVGDNLLNPKSPMVRGSLSGYYYTGTRDFFVGGMSAIAVFLVTYKVFERSLNNLLTVIAGIAAQAVAYFPTARAEDPTLPPVPLTPLQERLGEATVSRVHFTTAGIFILSLALISFFFGLQEGRRGRQRVGRMSKLPPGFWRWFHWLMALAIVGAFAFMVVARREHMFTTHALLIGQIVAIVAFGLSWLAKGLELDVLLGSRSRRRAVAAQNP
jgi:hypothetical protein